MAELDGLDAFDDQVAALEGALQGARLTGAAFEAQLRRIEASFADMQAETTSLSRSISGGLRTAFDGLIFDGRSLSDALRTVAQSMSDAAYSVAIKPVTDHVGALLGTLVGGAMNAVSPFADGAGFAQGRVMPFPRGGVVTRAATFPMRGGLGLMGEAGPEAILPLTRGPSGRLGVEAGGGGRAVHVTMNITTPDAEGFRRSEGQIAARLGRALARGNRYS